MADDHQRQVPLLLQIAEQLQIARLYRDVQSGRRFVCDQQFRAACHSDRAHDALSHAAAEFMGELASASLWIGDRNAVQQAQDFLIHCLFRGSLSVADCLSDL